jgi:hypothetical protein
MERGWRIVYSGVSFCSFNTLNRRVLLILRETEESYSLIWRGLNRGFRPGQI